MRVPASRSGWSALSSFVALRIRKKSFLSLVVLDFFPGGQAHILYDIAIAVPDVAPLRSGNQCFLRFHSGCLRPGEVADPVPRRLVPELTIVFVGCQKGMRLAICLFLELGSRLGDGAASVVLGIAFVTGAMLGNLLDELLGIVAAR
jgi:hypothetical protein